MLGSNYGHLEVTNWLLNEAPGHTPEMVEIADVDNETPLILAVRRVERRNHKQERERTKRPER